jgi:hypothetical protein
MERVFEKETSGKIALEKFSKADPDYTTNPNFRIYEVGWLETGGHPCTWDTLEVKGALFREAKRGPRKGLLCIVVEGTKRTAYVTRSEMKAFEEKEKASEPEYKYEVNNCSCHPETCACNPFKITDREGNKLTTAFTEDQAQKIVEKLNK